MQLTRFTDIGLRVVTRLAVNDDPLTTRTLAEELAVPYTHVTKVVRRLGEMGVVHTRRGRTGGLAITELGRQAPVGWLTRTLEGDGEVVECEGAQPCPLRTGCRLRGALATAQAAFYRSLDEHRVADLADPPARAVLLTLARSTPRLTASVVDSPHTAG